MTTPFFSIVVPTRNRPHYVVDSVRSLLRQTFTDFEIIISDNSSEGDSVATRQSLEPLLADPRCRYIRPGKELNMVAHWEWAVQHAVGEYVGILTDRMALRHYTLAEVAALAERSQTASICTAAATVIERPGHFALPKPGPHIISREIDSGAKLHEFSLGNMKKDCPRMLNSWTRNSVISELREKYGRVYQSISPDYFFCFLLMDHIKSFVSIDTRLLVVQGEHLSNGRAFKIGQPNEASLHFMKEIEREQLEWLQCGPIKGDVWIIPNSILREYEAVARGSVTGKMPPVDLQSFYLHTLEYLKNLADAGELSETALESMRKFRLDHDLHPLEPLQALALRLGEERPKAKPLRALRNRIRVKLEPAIAHAGLGKKVVGSSLDDLLQADARLYSRQHR